METLDHHDGRPTWAEIDLDALAANFHNVRRRVKPQEVMAVVKANAYGHGAAACARRLVAEGAKWLAVALPEEGIALRQAGVTQRILVLGGFWRGQEAACLRYKLIPVIYHAGMAEALDRAAHDAGTIAEVHAKIDTGMNRLGERFEHASAFAVALARLTNIRVGGLMTHFAAADEHKHDDLTAAQIARYDEALSVFRAHKHPIIYEHLSNSAGALAHKEARGNIVRPGGVLYGLWRDVLPTECDGESLALRPVMSLKTRITLLKNVPADSSLGYGCTYRTVRETLVATLPIGYNDGYTRSLSNRGRVIVRGTYAPVVGRISMDLMMVDVTYVRGAALGDTVTLIGADGDLRLSAEAVAETAGTISYEITCGISERVPRLYSPTIGA